MDDSVNIKQLKTLFAQRLAFVRQTFEESNLRGDVWAEELHKEVALLEGLVIDMKEEFQRSSS